MKEILGTSFVLFFVGIFTGKICFSKCDIVFMLMGFVAVFIMGNAFFANVGADKIPLFCFILGVPYGCFRTQEARDNYKSFFIKIQEAIMKEISFVKMVFATIHGAIRRVTSCMNMIVVFVQRTGGEKADKTRTENGSKSSYQEQEQTSQHEEAERQRREEAMRRERKRRAEEARQRRARSEESSYSREEGKEDKGENIAIPRTRKEAYAILGVSENASKEECHRAYRQLQGKYHVDKYQKFEGMRREAERATVLINLAWDILR